MKGKKRFVRLKTKIILWAIIPLIMSFILISTVFLLSASNSLQRTSEAVFLQIGQKYAYSFKLKVSEAMNYLSMLASELEARTEAGRTSRERLYDVILKIFQDYDSVISSSVYFEPNAYDRLDAEYAGTMYGTPQSGRISWHFSMHGGEAICSSSNLEIDTEADFPCYTGARDAGGPIHTDTAIYEVKGKQVPMFTLAQPMYDAGGKFIGAITVDLFLDDIYTQLENEKIYQSGYILICDENERLIYSPRYEDIGEMRSAAELTYELPVEGDKSALINSKSIISRKDTLVTINYVHIPKLNKTFYISVTAPLDEIGAETGRLTLIFTIFSASVVAAVALLLYYRIGKISDPLNEITESLDKIADNDYNTRIRGDYKGEFAIIKDSVNTMADSIKRYTEDSQNSLNILTNMLNGINAYLYVTDPATDEILYINDNMRKHFNLKGDGIGRICWQVLQSGFTERCSFCPCHQLDKEPGKPVVWEEHNSATGGYYQNTDCYIDWIGGKKVHLQHSVDMTELITAKEQAMQASKSKSEFLSRMSHEMRTPMNAIIGMTNIAKSSNDPDKKEYCLDRIGDASRHLLGVINDILDMSKIEANKFELSFAAFNFQRMLTNAINVVNFRMDEKRHKFSLYLDPEIPHSVVGDEQHLLQVITNLMTNAVKFTPEDGSIRLDIRLNNRENKTLYLQIEVSDSGIGISKEQQRNLFRSFEQADGNIARKYGGTGLGLAICKHIVELMGGRIWVESESGQGSKFAFTFSLEEELNAVNYNEYINLSDLNIMAVDDSPEVIDYFKHVLDGMGISCTVASGGAEALRLLTDAPKPFDMVFVDWRMPVMNGIEFTKEIRSLFEIPPVIIMISVAEWIDIKKDALNAGVNGFLPKPLFPSLIMDCINKHLGKVTANSGSGENPAVRYSFTGKTVLLADDVDINREIIITLLEETGITIDCAENGQQSIEMFMSDPGKYDMIFMDVHMPEVDGLEATRRIRALDLPEAKQIPIIAMTANVFQEDIAVCLKSGMNAHIGKPIDFQEVFSKLREYLN